MTNAKRLILLVDDNDISLDGSKLYLLSKGYRVVTAETGEQALILLKSSTMLPDILITDLSMPMMNGVELVRCMLQQGFSIPYILTTAHALHDLPDYLPEDEKQFLFIKCGEPDDLLRLIESRLQVCVEATA